MQATRIYFENWTETTIWLLLKANTGTLEIHVHDGPAPGAVEIFAKKTAAFPVDAAVASCIHVEDVGGVKKGRLEYQLLGHNDADGPLGPVAIVPGAVRFPDGPIFQISSEIG